VDTKDLLVRETALWKEERGRREGLRGEKKTSSRILFSLSCASSASRKLLPFLPEI
jgi:hypothetical protein